MDEQRVLSWLTSQDVFEIKDEIEEVNRKMLDKLLEENEFVSVYFCNFFLKVILFLDKILLISQFLIQMKTTAPNVKTFLRN